MTETAIQRLRTICTKESLFFDVDSAQIHTIHHKLIHVPYLFSYSVLIHKLSLDIHTCTSTFHLLNKARERTADRGLRLPCRLCDATTSSFTHTLKLTCRTPLQLKGTCLTRLQYSGGMVQSVLVLLTYVFATGPFGRREGDRVSLVNFWDRHSRKNGAAVTCGTCTEQTRSKCGVLLRCPPGELVVSVVTASFAEPRVRACGQAGGLGGFLYGGNQCSPTPQVSSRWYQVAHAACVGRPNCHVPADFNTLGDPCPGLRKTLTIQVACAKPTSLTPPPTPCVLPGEEHPGTLLPGFCAPISALEAPGGDLREVDLNQKKSSCRVKSSDCQLLAECRKRVAAAKGARPSPPPHLMVNDGKPNVLGAPEKTAWVNLDNAPVLKEIAREDVHWQAKYEERVKRRGGCEQSKGMWGNAFNSRCTILTMAKIGPYLPGQTVLDWGTGCGHQATFLTKQFGVHVVGIDLNAAAVQWANEHSVGRFVGPVDGTDLSWLPDASFDHFYSFATVIYVRPENMCNFGKEVVRILRPGGTALFGWMDGIYSRPYGQFAKSNFNCVKALPDVAVTTPSEGPGGIYSDTADDLISACGSYAVVMRKKRKRGGDPLGGDTPAKPPAPGSLPGRLTIRLAALEDAVFGKSVGAGGLVPRVQTLEKTLLGEKQNGTLSARLSSLEAALH